VIEVARTIKIRKTKKKWEKSMGLKWTAVVSGKQMYFGRTKKDVQHMGKVIADSLSRSSKRKKK
jgi:hypothetical protein